MTEAVARVFREEWGRWTDGPHARIELTHHVEQVLVERLGRQALPQPPAHLQVGDFQLLSGHERVGGLEDPVVREAREARTTHVLRLREPLSETIDCHQDVIWEWERGGRKVASVWSVRMQSAWTRVSEESSVGRKAGEVDMLRGMMV